MRKMVKIVAALMAAVLVIGCFAGCKKKDNKDSTTIATYNGQEFDVKTFKFFAEFFKDSYANNNGYATGTVDESKYMTLKHILVSFEKEDGTTITKEEALAKANEIKAQITNDNFDELVATYSEDPGSISQPGGYTFAHGDGTMVIQFDDGGWALEVGQVSDPVETPYGYHIIKRVELNKDALPKNIDWNMEIEGENGEKTTALESVKKQAYDVFSIYAVTSSIAKEKGKTLSEDEKEAAKNMVYNDIFGGEQTAAEFFDRIGYSQDDIKAICEMLALGDALTVDDMGEINCAELFDAFVASDYYKEMVNYYAMYGMSVEYSEYNAEDTELNALIKDYEFDRILTAEQEKVEKNETVYNNYK